MHKITYSVMAHPARAELHPYLEQYFDRWAMDYNSEGPWENRKRAHRMYDSDSDYHFVIQDDAILSTNFFEDVQTLVEQYPGYAFSLFANFRLNKFIKRRDRTHGFDRTVIYPRVHWGVAFGLPVEHIEPYLEFGEQYTPKLGIRGDETRLSYYMLSIGLQAVYPFPCLVDHREVPSVVGNKVGPHRSAFAFEG